MTFKTVQSHLYISLQKCLKEAYQKEEAEHCLMEISERTGVDPVQLL